MRSFWDGQDCIRLDEVIGHTDWAHKAGILLVKNSSGIVYLAANTIIKKNSNGEVIGDMDENCLPYDVLASAKRFFADANRKRH